MRFPLASLTILLAAAPAAALDLPQAPAPATSVAQPSDASPPIVVTGIRVDGYRERLARCLARNCPVNEDVDATMALAEALFLNGDFESARRAVRASLGRNRHQAAAFPEPVSDLFRVNALLSRQLGFDRVAIQSTHGILNSLQAGLPREDHRHFTARFEVAEMQMAMGRTQGARRGLAELARVARAAGREDVAALAELRGLWFEYSAYPYGETRRRLAGMAQSTDPGQAVRTTGARILLSRIYRLEGDEARANAMLAEIGQGMSGRRRLLHAPSYTLQRQEVAQGFELTASPFITSNPRSNTNNRFTGGGPSLNAGTGLARLPENVRGMWIDIGFWVMPDGRISGLEILRQGADPGWADPLLDSVRGRRYSAAEEASYRLERYIYTARLETASGTRGLQRSPRVRAEYFDLTEPNPAPPPTPDGGG